MIFRFNAIIIILVLTLAMALACPTLPAYAAPPDSGTALEGVKPPTIQRPVDRTPSITIEGQAPSVQSGDQQKFMVSGFKISGEVPLPAAELQKIIQSEVGKELTLDELNHLAGKLTKYLQQKGYLVAFAYIPRQDIKDGIVQIAVIPGKYGRFKITGSAHIDIGLLQAMLFTAKPGNFIKREPLDRALLLISDLSGIGVKATFTPGETSGTADLVLETTDTDKISGALYTDNWGNRYTGRQRYGAQLTINNLSNIGDALTLGGLFTGKGISSYNLGYSLPFGRDGAKFEIKHSSVSYTLGEDLANLDASGRAFVTNWDVSYPLVRSRAFNLYGTVGYDDKHLLDDTVSTHSSKTRRLWNTGLSGNFNDTLGGGGTNAFSLTHYQGKLNIKDATAAADDAIYLNTAGNFSKTVLTYQRQQYIGKNLNFNFSFIGQLADKNLDSSEKLCLGGADGVRAYPQGEASGDQGYRLTGELRWRLPEWSKGKNNFYLTGFYDYGNVEINKHPYASTGDNHRRLMGAGLGLLWTYTPDFAFRLDYAWKIGHETVNTDKNGRLWLQGVVYF